MEDMLQQKKHAHKNTANIGKLFLYIAILIIIGMALFVL